MTWVFTILRPSRLAIHHSEHPAKALSALSHPENIILCPSGLQTGKRAVLKALRNLNRLASSQGEQEDLTGCDAGVGITSPVQQTLTVGRDQGISAAWERAGLPFPRERL